MGKIEEIGKKNVTDELQTLGALLRRSFEYLLHEVYRSLAKQGFPELRPAHGVVFRYVLPEGSRAVDLARAAGMTKQSMSYLVDSLITSGYVEMHPDPTDGRAKVVCLTEKGSRAQQAAVNESERVERSLVQQVGADNYAIMRQCLAKMSGLGESGPEFSS